MKKKNIIFCTTIYPKNEHDFIALGLKPVGLGNKEYNNFFLRDNTGDNISHKNNSFGEYTFHYWLWKNYLKELKKFEWIGFYSYRRFFLKKENVNTIENSTELKKTILNSFENFSKYDAIITKPIIFEKNYKFMKIIKNYGFLNSMKEPTIFFKKQKNIYDHFKIFHGKKYLEDAINLLDKKTANEFRDFLINNNKFNAYNIFAVKNVDILEAYYGKIFPWLFKCEEKFSNIKFRGYEVRKIAFLSEIFCNYWFKTNCKTFENNFIFFDTNTRLV